MQMLTPILLVVGANTIYNICAKGVPARANSFAALLVTYLVAAGLCVVLFYLTGGERNLLQEVKALNWAPIVLGCSIVFLELGYILIYRAGWKISVASLVANIALACVLVVLGGLLYKERLSMGQVFGMLLCASGLFFIGRA